MAIVKLAVVGVPELVPLLTAAGFKLLTDSTDPESVASAVRNFDGRLKLIVRASIDPRVKPWTGLMLQQGHQVVVLRGDGDPDLGLSPEASAVNLPATMDSITAKLGAPPRPGGDTLIGLPAAPPTPAPADEWGWGDESPVEQTVEQPAVVVPQVEQPSWASAGEGQPPVGGQPSWAQPAPPVEQQQWPPAQSQPSAPAPEQSWQQPAPVTPVPAPQQPQWQPVEQSATSSASPVDPWGQVGQQPQPQQGGNMDVFGAPGSHPGRRMQGDKCPVLVCWAGKGGSGKSSISLAAAAEAANAGLRVVLVDMNRGQGDIRAYLRLSRDQKLFTVYDAALNKSPKSAIISPTTLTEARHQLLPPVKFGVAFAPRPGQSNPTTVTSEFYRAVIEAAREHADLVIVDTQIMEDSDTSGLIDGVAIPLVRTHMGWGFAIADSSMPGIQNTIGVMDKFGVGADKMMFMVNKMVPDSTLSVDQLDRMMYNKATVMGTVPLAEEVVTLTEQGRLPNDFEPMGDILRAVLLRVTGNEAFQKREVASTKKKKRGLFGFGK